jgi:protein-tyrosine phosphatase
MAFRRLELPQDVRGGLYLSSMPGYYHPFKDEVEEARSLGISLTLRLTSDVETESKSPEYMDSIRRRLLAWEELHFPIADYGVPTDPEAFRSLVKKTASALEAGKRVLVHCAAGIGRTGVFAACLLIELGLDTGEARAAVTEAGSYAEDPRQLRFLEYYKLARDERGRKTGS